jgi:ferredoxin
VRTKLVIVTVCAAVLGGLAGWSAGPFLARGDLTVQVAARVALEDAQGLQERTLESEAFRATGRPESELYAEARQVVQRFRVGAALLGLFCGLALGMKLLGQSAAPRFRTYTIDQDECVSCGRCFAACPRERLRLKGAAARREGNG